MNSPVYRLTYDEEGQRPVILTPAGFIRWPQTVTDNEERTIYMQGITGVVSKLNVPESEASSED